MVIANWPEVRIQHWLTLLEARAIENQAYVIGVNRCGNDPNLPILGVLQFLTHKAIALETLEEKNLSFWQNSILPTSNNGERNSLRITGRA